VVSVSPLLSLLLIPALYSAFRPIRRSCTSFAVCSVLGGVSGILMALFWNVQVDAIVDRILHVNGVGRLLFQTSAVVGFLSHYVGTALVTKRWTWWPAGPVGAAALLVLSDVAWAATRGHGSSPLFYDGFPARPLPALLMNVGLGSSLVLSCALGVVAFARMRAEVRPEHHFIVNDSLALFSCATLFGVLVLAQVLLALSTGDTTDLIPVMVSFAVVFIVVAMLSTIHILGRARLRQWLVRREDPEEYQLVVDGTEANILLSALCLPLYRYANREIVPRISGRCTALGLAPYRRKVALEAARWMTTERTKKAELRAHRPYHMLDPKDARAIDCAIVTEAQFYVERDDLVYGDVFRVVVLVLGSALSSDIAQRHKLPGWHAEVAAIIGPMLDNAGAQGGTASWHIVIDRRKGPRTNPARKVDGRPTPGPTGSPRPVALFMSPIARACLAPLERKAHPYLSRWLRSEHMKLRLNRNQAVVLLSDRRKHLSIYAHPDTVRAVADRCTERTFLAYQRRTTVEAARWITFNLDNALLDEEYHDPTDVSLPTTARVPQIRASLEQESRLSADVYRVLMLVVGPTYLPEIARRYEGPGWRHDAAVLIRDVLEERGMLDSIRREMEGGSRERAATAA